MTWVLNHLEPESPQEMPSRLWWKGQAYRRRRMHRTYLATLFGPVVLWRRFEPLAPGGCSIHPLELRLGLEAGLATPALAKRIGGWATGIPNVRCWDVKARSWRAVVVYHVAQAPGVSAAWRPIAMPPKSIKSSAGSTRSGVHRPLSADPRGRASCSECPPTSWRVERSGNSHRVV